MGSNNKEFIDFLHWKVAEEYMLKHAVFPKISDEVSGSKTKMYKLYIEDITQLEEFRKELWNSLSTQENLRASAAKKWSHYLNVRKSALSFWSSTFIGAYIALFGSSAVLFVIFAKLLNQPEPYWILAFFAIITFGFGLIKFYLERKQFWYDFLKLNLEEILDRELMRAKGY